MPILPRYLSILLILAFAFAFSACDSDDNGNGGEFDINLYTGGTYTGTAFVDLIRPGHETISQSGAGAAEVHDLGNGEARLLLEVQLEGSPPDSFPFEGPYDENGWSLEGGIAQVSADGDISGEGTQTDPDLGEIELSMQGAISSTALDLALTTDFISGNDGIPPGSRLDITWTLDRGQPALTSQIEASTEREFNREGGEFSVGALVGRVLEMLDKSE